MDRFADRTSCHQFGANQYRLLLSSAAYVLVQALGRTAWRGTDLERAPGGTICLKLLKVAARVVIAARRIVFHRARSDPYAERFRAVLEQVMNPAIPGRAAVG